jgi:hypothetical protein
MQSQTITGPRTIYLSESVLRVFDCLVLNDELALLEERFRRLACVPEVTHVICEAEADENGNPKPLHFLQTRMTRFLPWNGRWNHVMVQENEIAGILPGEYDHVLREEFMLLGFNGDPEDIILAGDIRCIPGPADVARLASGEITPGKMPFTAACYRYQSLIT